MEDGNGPIPRYIFAAVFIAACLYNLELGLRVAGLFLAGLSLYYWVIGKVPLVDQSWTTTGYLTGAAGKLVSASTMVIAVMFFFFPGPVVSALATLAR